MDTILLVVGLVALAVANVGAWWLWARTQRVRRAQLNQVRERRAWWADRCMELAAELDAAKEANAQLRGTVLASAEEKVSLHRQLDAVEADLLTPERRPY